MQSNQEKNDKAENATASVIPCMDLDTCVKDPAIVSESMCFSSKEEKLAVVIYPIFCSITWKYKKYLVPHYRHSRALE